MSATKRDLILLPLWCRLASLRTGWQARPPYGLVLLILVIILLAGLARVALALHNHRALYDEVLVMEMADQLVKGQGYTLEFIWFPALAREGWPQPDPQAMPLLPTLIAGVWWVVGQSVPVANAVTATIAAICVLAAFLMGWRVGGPGAGLIAAAVMLVSSRYLHVSITCLTSPVYGLFLALAVWAFVEALCARSDRERLIAWAGLGLTGGLAWLTRPEGPLILPALALAAGYLWLRQRQSGGGARRLVIGLALAAGLLLLVASPLIAYNLTNYGAVTHATGRVNQWSWDYDARFSVTPPTAEAYWAQRTLASFLTLKAENLAWMLTLLGEYLTWPILALLLAAAGLAIWRASPLAAIVVYTLVYLAASWLQYPMSIWPGTQYFMYYSGLLPLWAVLIGWGLRELGPVLWATPARRFAAVVALGIGLAWVLPAEGERMLHLADGVGRSRTELADPRLRDFQWLAEHTSPQAIVMTWDPHNLHWYSDHRRAVMIPTDDARTIQAFLRRWGVTHFYYNDWLVERRPALQPLRRALHTGGLGPNAILQPEYSGEGILLRVNWAVPPAVLLVAPNPATEEAIAQKWLGYVVTSTVPADLTAYPAAIVRDGAPGLSAHLRQPVEARFGENIELLGYEAPPARPGESLQVTLYWRCLAPVEKDYTVFNHLLDVQGARVAQQDDPPANRFYPTSQWRPGEVIVDRHTIVLPADAPPGDYQLAVGLYELATMQRVPVPGGGDAVVLAPIVIGRQP